MKMEARAVNDGRTPGKGCSHSSSSSSSDCPQRGKMALQQPHLRGPQQEIVSDASIISGEQNQLGGPGGQRTSRLHRSQGHTTQGMVRLSQLERAVRPRGLEAQRPRGPVSKHVLLHGGLDRRSAWGWSKVGLPLKASLNGNGEVGSWAGAFGVQ